MLFGHAPNEATPTPEWYQIPPQPKLTSMLPRSGMEPPSSSPKWGSRSSLKTANRTCLGSVSPLLLPWTLVIDQGGGSPCFAPPSALSVPDSTGHALLEDENRVWHLVRPTDEVDEGKSKRGSVKEKERTKAITEIYLTRLLSVKVALGAGRVLDPLSPASASPRI